MIPDPNRFLLLLPAVGALLALAGCGDGPGGETAGGDAGFCGELTARVDSFIATRAEGWSPPSDRYGGTAVASGGGALTGLNPLTSQDYTTVQHQNFVHNMTLIRYDEDLEPVPWLAESWEVAPDSSSVTFHLRDDVYWHDGVKTTAEDVVFTYELMNEPATAFPNVSFWDQYEKGPGAVEVVDSFTVRIGMLRPHAEFMDPWRSASLVPAHILRDVPPGELSTHPFGQSCAVGNGPFVLVDHRAGESWTFAANPAFPEALGGRPRLDRLVYRVVAEPSTALNELLTGGTHLFSQPPPEYALEIETAVGVELRHFPHRTYTFVGWNTLREKLSDPRVRRAMTHALDRPEMVEALMGGYAQVAQTTVPPLHWAYDERFEDALPHDPERARALLDEAGWRDRNGDGIRENESGTPLSFRILYNGDNQVRRSIAEIMQSRLAAVGVEATPAGMEYQTVLQRVANPDSRDFDAVVLGFTNEFKLDDRAIFHSESRTDLYGFAGLDDPRLDHLIDTLQVVVDRDDAKELWEEYQERLIELQPFTFIFFAERLAGLSESLNGVEMDSRGEWINASEWWLAPESREGGR